MRLSMEAEQAEEEAVDNIEMDELMPIEKQSSRSPFHPDENVSLDEPEQVVETHSNAKRPSSSRIASIPAPIHETPQGATEEDVERMDEDCHGARRDMPSAA